MGSARILVALLAVDACSVDQATEIMLVVDSDLPVPDRIDEIRLAITTASSSNEGSYRLAPTPVIGTEQLPLSLGLVPSGRKDGLFRVVAEGRKAGAPVVSQSASSAFLPNQKRILTLRLDRLCAAVPCPPGQTCRADATRDACVREDVDPLSLPRVEDGGLPPPRADGPTDGAGAGMTTG